MMTTKATYTKTREGTVIKEELVLLNTESLRRGREGLLEVLDSGSWDDFFESASNNLEATWGPYVEQLSDTEFRWRAYERWEEVE